MAASVTAEPDATTTRSDRRRRLLTVVDGLVFGLVIGAVLAFSVNPIAGLAAFVVVAVVVSVLIARAANAFVVFLVGAQAVEDDEYPGLRNVIEGLCATFGLRVPRLMVLEDPVANSCVFGSGEGATLVVTTGLVDVLDLIETEGVIAHELAHLKNHDAALSAVALTALAPWVYLTGSDHLVHVALGRGREYLADQTAAKTVRYPPGLHDGMARIEQGPAPRSGSVFTGRRFALTRWLWIDPMVADRQASVEGELDATAVRIAALAEW